MPGKVPLVPVENWTHISRISSAMTVRAMSSSALQRYCFGELRGEGQAKKSHCMQARVVPRYMKEMVDNLNGQCGTVVSLVRDPPN
jgi:hypothetical protein